MDKKLKLNLEFIGKAFALAGDDDFIKQMLREMPEQSIRFVLDVVKDEDLPAYLEFFEEMQEYEWCRVIAIVIQQRKTLPS